MSGREVCDCCLKRGASRPRPDHLVDDPRVHTGVAEVKAGAATQRTWRSERRRAPHPRQTQVCRERARQYCIGRVRCPSRFGIAPRLPMSATGRLFLCARCRVQVVLCSRCDHGNVYCSQDCARTSRRASMRAAGQRYQTSRAGRFAHAERARRYRARRKNVTHQGSPAPGSGDSLDECIKPTLAAARFAPPGTPDLPCCTRCGRPRAHAVRQGWLRRRYRGYTAASTGPPWSTDDLG